ncbi:putative Uncharacterized protein ZC84.1 [Hypsibius exemplaris]|uniref:Papilin n=1 Tax=Hypsibius exemplaris TaxID=2072580 RepID=A0A1W0WKJ3_HYPEX|nr:putative Uncharacterized protein ZC84.1 [Hypsibius exemplaris]
MGNTLLFLSLPALICLISSSFALSATKPGLCAPPSRLFITGTMQKCSADADCPYDSKCCDSKSGIKVCAPAQPAFSACQHQRVIAEEVARSIDSSINFTPECLETNGSFAPIQCSEAKQRCWCVNEAGFEVAGTRVPLGTPVKLCCAAPRVCPNPECRMLCPQSFRIMKDGCPRCECYDACDEIKCPRSTKCVTEELTCVNEPCPPISRCSARSIDDVDCPSGLPALVDTNKKDYHLCSLLDSIKASKCPSGFDCNVRPGKEFGVCCPLAKENIIKPGQCPALNTTSGNSCIVECLVDQDCYGDAKCCSDNCTARCLAPVTLTACQAQKAAVTNVPGLFTPACDTATGQYSQVQCSGQKCWCVDPITGVEKSGTRTVNGSLPNCSAPKHCSPVQCDLQCEHGVQFDPEGCPICACYNPCEELSCPNGCNLLNIDCGEQNCPSVATCKESRSLDHPCIYGKPVLDNQTRDYVICGDASRQLAGCPATTKCEPIDAEGHGVCCPMPGTVRSKQLHGDRTDEQLALTKPEEHLGKCPKPLQTHAARSTQCGANCRKDFDCGIDEKCCDNDCGWTCVKAVTKTACQVSAEFWLSAGLNQETTFIPKCDSKGSYEPIQCLGTTCWCVDNLGREIDGTRKPKGQTLDCSKPKECGPQCRMFCPFDFTREEDGCSSTCECAPSPCDKIACPSQTECKLTTLDCVKEPCPIAPKCVVKAVALPICPFGEPLIDAFSNKTIPCGLTSDEVENSDCPVTHICTHPAGGTADGVCCQRQSVDICHLPKETGPCRAAMPRWHFDKTTKQCQQFIYGGCDGNLNNFQTKELCEHMCTGAPAAKSGGHCPLPSMDGPGTCQVECGSDADCPGTSLCCSNGCGQVCMAETFASACDIQNTAMARLLPLSLEENRAKAVIPECQSDGKFNQRQCSDPLGRNATTKECWCVKENGLEIDGSRRLASAPQIECTTIADDLCKETMMCRMDCPFGFKHDPADGCPVCDCEDPCEMISCPNGRECKVIEMKAVHNTTTRVPICAPHAAPALTCPFGEPIRIESTNQIRVCLSDSACPATHACSMPEGAHTGICCSKTSSVCQMLPDPGLCRAALPRWSFNPTKQACERFIYGGCLGNGNNFESATECAKVCGGSPVPEPSTPAPVDVCRTGKAIPWIHLNGSSSATMDMCTTGSGCPLTHSCAGGDKVVACCEKTSDDCFLPVISGQCKAAIPRYHFNPKTKACEQYVYSGCGANGNSFASYDQCKNLCPVMSQCEAIRQAAVQLQSNSSVPLFVPECDEFDGSWLPVQCQPALGMCWCVDKNGRADMTTAVRGYPTCSGKTTVLASTSNASAEVCPEGEAMQFCDPQLCRQQVCFGHPRAQCRINPCGGCTTDFFDSDNHKVDCNEGLSECQIEFQTTVHSSSWSKLQIPAPLFAPGTKSSSNGAQIVQIVERAENGSAKLGMCPPYFALPHEGCAIECHTDSQCADDLKCCFAGCGYTCVSPIPLATAKPGQCPVNEPTDVPTTSEKCEHSCVDDTECGGSRKCCNRGKCDLVCLEPVVEPVLMPLYIAGLRNFRPLRVDPVQRRDLLCNDSGIVAGVLHPVCPGEVKPEVCKDTCRDAQCHGRPDAFCVADPCNGCKVQFADQQGKIVQCGDSCDLPMERGICAAGDSERYYFNGFTQECRPFNYSGCGGNENNFLTKDECLKRCLPKDICMQDISTGPCRALIERWAYNKKTHQCEQFDYGGCQGNGNNFETKAQCENRCPEILVCPRLSATATVSTCNRSGRCDHAKCAHPLATCRVEPCSCAPEFVDKWGRQMNCSELPTKCQQEALERSVMADVYHPQCMSSGKYQPMQCFADHFSEKCWCVDESGNVLDDAKFTRGTRNCAVITIASTRIYMKFSAQPETTDDLIKDTVTEILNLVSQDNAVESLEILPGKHHVVANVALHGSRTADVAYFFEKMMNITKLPPALSLLELRVNHERPYLNSVLMDDRALSPMVSLDAPVSHSPDLLPLLAILGVAVVVIAILGIILYRRHRTGSYTNRDQVKDFEKVLPSDAPLKVMPNDYASIPAYTKPADHIYEIPKENVKL